MVQFQTYKHICVHKKIGSLRIRIVCRLLHCDIKDLVICHISLPHILYNSIILYIERIVCTFFIVFCNVKSDSLVIRLPADAFYIFLVYPSISVTNLSPSHRSDKNFATPSSSLPSITEVAFSFNSSIAFSTA